MKIMIQQLKLKKYNNNYIISQILYLNKEKKIKIKK